MKNFEVVLYKMSVYAGKEDIAKEWLDFLNTNKERGSEILVSEKAYYEAYFTSVENDVMYIYMTFASDNIEFSNQTAFASENEVDKKHFEYMIACIDREKSLIIPATLQLNRIG